MLAALDLGLIYGLMALGVYLTFRILDFPDLTVDGSFTTGAAVATVMIVGGQNPLLATVCGAASGLVAGAVTGMLHTKGGINPLLAGILTQIALYSINLRIMGRANLSLLRIDTLTSPLADAGLTATWVSIAVFGAVAVAFKFGLDWFLKTDLGLALQATGDNERMIRSLGVSTDGVKIWGVALSNGLVALSGAILAQYQGYADIGMGIGLIVAGLASVIIGQALIASHSIWITTAAVLVGSVVYRVVIQVALGLGLNPNDMKLVSAILVIAALLLPRLAIVRRWRARQVRRELARSQADAAAEAAEAAEASGAEARRASA